jgi:GAF domain-containing protein
MQSAPMQDNEKERLEKIKELGILDTEPEERFDMITRDALKEFKVPISTVTIIDENREWYKSCQGLDVKEMPRDLSFCAHAMLSNDIFIIEDTLKDDRFKDNPMVVDNPHVRFYAGISLHNKEGIAIGVFCIKDTKPRVFSANEMGLLINFAARAENELNTKV